MKSLKTLYLDRNYVPPSVLRTLPHSITKLRLSFFDDTIPVGEVEQMDLKAIEDLLETFRKQGRNIHVHFGYREGARYSFKNWTIKP